MLAVQSQRLAARREQLQACRGREQRSDPRRGGDDVLDVVEEHERRPVGDPIRDQLPRRRTRGLADSERPRERRHDQLRVGERGERDEEDAVGKTRRRAARDLEGQPGLAGSARAREREQAHVVAQEEAPRFRQLPLASDERRRRRRQAGGGDHGGGLGEPGILVEDLALQPLQLRPRLDAELVDESRARVLVCVECLGLPARAVQREHQLRTEPLAQRRFGDQLLELGDDVVVAPER
jgi:hypothetical protein